MKYNVRMLKSQLGVDDGHIHPSNFVEGEEYHIGKHLYESFVELGIVQKSGSWFSYNNDKLGQGRDAVRQLLTDNPEMAAEIEGRIREKIKEIQNT